MKRIVSIFIVVILLVTSLGLALAQDATASVTAAPNTPSTPVGDGSRLTGRITAVGDATVTITTMGQFNPQMSGSQPAGTPPQNGDQSGTQQGSAPAQGNSQTGDSGAQANGNAPGGAPAQGGANGTGDMPAMPEEQTVTVTVTQDTAITSGATMETLTLRDLVVGMMVEITVEGSETDGYTALTIQTQAEQYQTPVDTATPADATKTRDAT